MIQAVIFDMDGVIVDTELAYQKRRQAFLEAYGYNTEGLPWVEFIGENFASKWELIEERVDVDCATLQKRYIQYKKEHPLSYEGLAIPTIVQGIKQLYQAGYTLALASSSTREDIERCLTLLQLRPYFRFVLSGQDFPKTKPDPAIYRCMQQKLGLKAEEIIVVEDSKVGIQAAKDAGLFVLAYYNPLYQQDQSWADAQLTKEDYLYEWIQEKNEASEKKESAYRK